MKKNKNKEKRFVASMSQKILRKTKCVVFKKKV